MTHDRMNQSQALALAGEALDLWQEGRLAEADARHREALAVADPSHFRTPDVHGQYGRFLISTNRLSEAGPHLERALQLELENDPDEASPPVVVARYFLGEHYLAMGDPDSARRVVAPSLTAAQKPFAWLVEAEALALAGATEEARTAAERAIALASGEQKERMHTRLADLLDERGAGQ
jgi:Tfp pilus assembly protein PilF